MCKTVLCRFVHDFICFHRCVWQYFYSIFVFLPMNTHFSEARSSLPRLQYVSMVMTDTTLTDANKSLELNALALKYLQDEQLTELAQLTVHKSRRSTKPGEGSLLRQVGAFTLAQCEFLFEWNLYNSQSSFISLFAEGT